MQPPYGGGYAGRAHPSCNTSESHPDLTNLFAATKGQVAVALTVRLTGDLGRRTVSQPKRLETHEMCDNSKSVMRHRAVTERRHLSLKSTADECACCGSQTID